MILLNHGQRLLLEVLRNLTSQVLLASIAFVLSARLDFYRFALSNWLLTAAFFLSAALTLLASSSIPGQFTDALLESHVPYERIERRLQPVAFRDGMDLAAGEYAIERECHLS